MASIQDRSAAEQARWRVRWRDGRGAPVRSYTFNSAWVQRGASDAEKAARRLKAYVDLMGHHLGVVEALVGAGFRVEGFSDPDGVDETVTVAEFAERWLDTLIRASGRCRADYRRILNEHVLPVLGDLDISAVTSEQVALWLRSQEASGTGRGTLSRPRAPSPKTLANRHGVLSTMLEAAAKSGLRVGNPAKGLGPVPKSTHREMCFLTHREWKILWDCLQRPSAEPHHRPVDPTLGQHLALLLVASGMRWSETTALTVGQCDLSRAVLRVDRAWKRQADGSYVVGEPKSARAVRSVDVPEQVRAVLAERTEGRSADDLVFPAPRGGQYLSAWFYHRYWAPALLRGADAGLAKRPRVHDLRHTHAAWLIADGRPLASIQRRLGHESITTTIDRYGHLLPELEAGNAAAVERALAALEV